MIDTDKYEGHTQGHWATTTRKGTWVVYTQDNGDVATMNDYEDAKLIADAPLLLEEVKSLRRQNADVTARSMERLTRLQDHNISDPVYEQEYGVDEYTGEAVE